ncbi:MAG: hypothetical protein COA65_04020 [Rhodospirillaceae bacterium]|nr:MAG: hypothetical protein COA65_04020 [Rhodospirillaceae bacterium]
MEGVRKSSFSDGAAILFVALAGLAFFGLSFAARAAEETHSLGGRTVTVSQADCLKLTKHVPSADVAYKPGVDVRGRAVTPAETGGSHSIVPPNNFTVDITVRLDKRFNIPVTPDLYQPEATIGTITIEGDKAYFNGQPLVTESINKLAEICSKLAQGK